jgi:galactokinase/mevalonate kinase-like predicted kinase
LLSFVENALYLVPLGPRMAGFDVLADTVINPANAKALADAADAHWNAIMNRDIVAFGHSMREGFEAQAAMFPHMLDQGMTKMISEYRDRALGWKLSGAGGGGYLILVSNKPVQGAVRIIARRELG